jgi:hypothetical protein
MKITDRLTVAFLSAVVTAFVAGVTAYVFLEGKIEKEVSDQLKMMKEKGELQKGDKGDPGNPGAPGIEGKPGPIEVGVGTIMSFFGTKAPAGYLLCDGSEFSKSDYPELYTHLANVNTALILTAEKAKTPDLRGVFLRGLDSSGEIDPDGDSRKVGDSQPDGIRVSQLSISGNGSHRHSMQYNNLGGTSSDIIHYSYGVGGNFGKPAMCQESGNHSHSIEGGIEETRPKNVAITYIIKH